MLHIYNSHSPDINLDEWVNGVGPACYKCGEHKRLYLASNLSPLTSAFEAAHSASAANPPSGAAKSEIENLKSKMDCATCGDKFWENDLESVAVAWFQQAAVVLLCEDCLVEPRESKETGEEFDDSAALPGQMEIALATV